MSKLTFEEIEKRLTCYREEVKLETKPHEILMSEDLYVEDVDWLIQRIANQQKEINKLKSLLVSYGDMCTIMGINCIGFKENK